MNERDLTDALREWPFEAGRINARCITGRDGRPKLQVRIDLGVLQMEMEGRPDGQRPGGFESLLEQCLERQQRDGDQFVLSGQECRALREEAVQYYHRYVGLLALGDYAGVIHDTTRNLRVFDLCRDHAEAETDRAVLEQFRPFVVMMRARAAAELAIAAGDTPAALRALGAGIGELRGLYEAAGRLEDFEHASEVQLLRGMREALVPRLPASQRVELQERLRAALDAENYELAAMLRDELRLLE